jgi:hypothetical protein
MAANRKVNPLRKTAPGGYQFAVFAGRISMGDSDAGRISHWGIVAESHSYADIQADWRYWSRRQSSQGKYKLGLVRAPGPHEIVTAPPELTVDDIRAAESRYSEWLRTTRPTPEETERDRREEERADSDVL